MLYFGIIFEIYGYFGIISGIIYVQMYAFTLDRKHSKLCFFMLTRRILFIGLYWIRRSA